MGDKEEKDSWGNQNNQGQSWGNNQQGQGWGNNQQGFNQGNQGFNQGNQGWGNNNQGFNQSNNQGFNQGQGFNQNQGFNQGGQFNNIGVSGFEHFTNGNFDQYGASYAIRSAYGRVLDINQTQSNSASVGDAIIYDFYGGKNQRFTISNNGQDLIIRSVQDDRVLESIPGGQNTKGRVRLGPFNGSPNERWSIRKADSSNNLYFIVNAVDGKCLDVEGEKSGNNTNVITWQFNGKKNQMWEIIPVAPGVKSLPGNSSFGNFANIGNSFGNLGNFGNIGNIANDIKNTIGGVFQGKW